MNTRHRVRAGHAILFAACVLLASAADALLLEISQTFFTAGFNGVYLDGAGALAGFALISVLVDACLVAGVWALCLPPLARRRGTPAQKIVVASLAALAVPFSVDFVRYQVGLVLGRMAKVDVLFEVSGGGLRLMLSEAAAHAIPLAAVLLVAAAAAAVLVAAIGRLQSADGSVLGGPLPARRLLWLGFAGLLVASTTAIVVTANTSPRLAAGLAAKPSVALLTGLIQLVTDVDRDGFGLLSRPADPDPFDSSRQPFALDLPGNDIDENGMAGDLPANYVPPESVVASGVPAADARRPDFLLVYLESFRADLLDRSRNGREITPHLNALAREGAKSEHAYVHSPYTIWSRAQLFGGRLDPLYDQTTLVDDFHALGYEVAHFSGQDDSFGGSVELLGLDRVDHFYDAREDPDRRTSRGASAGSLQISWKLLLERVGAYLDAYPRGPDSQRPLFLYVNLVDTHFPYTHEEIDDLLGVAPLSRYEIRASNAERVRATYDNTAANVDLAISRLIEHFRSALGGRDHAILVTSDHGQALFERGFLGHGQSLTEDQTRAPFVLWGVGGDWPEPLAMSDVRGLLQRNLFVPRGAEVPRARFVPDPDRKVFHYMAQLHHPHRIGLRSLAGLTSFDLESETLELFDSFERSGDTLHEAEGDESTRAFDELIRAWEGLREAAGPPDPGDRRRRTPGAV